LATLRGVAWCQISTPRSGRISPIYLADAVVELGLIALLILTRLKQADRT
jgi:hypothetical protein